MKEKIRPRATCPPLLKNKFEPSFTTTRLASRIRYRICNCRRAVCDRRYRIPQFNGVTVHSVDPLAENFACENFTSIKRIEKEFFVSIVILDDEVAGHAHARDREFQPARDFHVNRGERDWNSDAPVEDVVKEA